MENNSKELHEFIIDINNGIIKSMCMKVDNPLHPNVEVLCLMDTLHVKFDVRVNANGHVTDGDDVAARLDLAFSYKPKKLEKSDDVSCSEDHQSD